MKRSASFWLVAVLSVLTAAAALRAQGRGGNPEAQARQRQQADLEAATPKLQITEDVLRSTFDGVCRAVLP